MAPGLWRGDRDGPWSIPGVIPGSWTLTFLHHADVHAALEPAGLAVPPVVLGDVAVPVEGTGEHGLPLHAPPEKGRERGKKNPFGAEFLLFWLMLQTPVEYRASGPAGKGKFPTGKHPKCSATGLS